MPFPRDFAMTRVGEENFLTPPVLDVAMYLALECKQ